MRKILNKCSRVSKLLYLYRDGELSPKEKSLIDNHTRICPECASLLKKLQATDSYLERYRTAPVTSVNEDEVISAVLQQIANHKVPPQLAGKVARTKYEIPTLLLPSWLRPALIGSLVIILGFLCYQQLRDALTSSALEQRLKERTPSYAMRQLRDERETGVLFRKLQGQEKLIGSLSSTQTKAVAGNQIYDKVLDLWRQLFENKNGFLDYLSKKYPELSSININDGLSIQERAILSTEGKALIKELEQLMKDSK
jgi:Putative zinc-finger